MNAASSQLQALNRVRSRPRSFKLAAIPFLALAASVAGVIRPVAAQSCTLRIHVDGFRNTRGNLGTIVFASPAGWPEDCAKALRCGPTPIDTSTRTSTAVWQVPPGNYGIAAIDDENSNARLDRDFLGIPKEGFGFANNPRVIFGAPPFHAAEVHVACPATDITIHLIYK